MIKTGTYSYYRQGELEIKDMKVFKQYREYLREKGREDYADLLSDENILEDQAGAKVITLEEMNEWKIVSYWYADTVDFFRNLAVFCEGSVHFVLETDDEAATIVLHEGEVTFKIGRMEYNDFDYHDLKEELQGRDGKWEGMPEFLREYLFKKKL